MIQTELIGEGKYQVAPHQQFVDRSGQLVRIVRGESAPIPVGKAYGFFDCRASKAEIESEIPTIRRLVKTPSTLELNLIEGAEFLEGDTELMQIAAEARETGKKYVIEATLPKATNRQTADELVGILNQVYQFTLYQNDKSFRGEILYKENDEYVSRK